MFLQKPKAVRFVRKRYYTVFITVREFLVPFDGVHEWRRTYKEIDIRIGKAKAALYELYRSMVIKRQLSNTAKLSMFDWSLFRYLPTHIDGHESWVMTERMLSKLQAAGTDGNFVKRSRRDTSRQSAQLGNSWIAECRASSVNGEISATLVRPYLQNAQGRFCWPCPQVSNPEFVQRPWNHCISDVVWSRVHAEPEELPEIAVDREVFRVLQQLLPLTLLIRKVGMKRNQWNIFAPNLNLSWLGGKFCYTRLPFLLDRREPSAGRATRLLFFNLARQGIEPSLHSLEKNYVFQNSWKKVLQNASYLASHQTSNFLLFDYILWS